MKNLKSEVQTLAQALLMGVVGSAVSVLAQSYSIDWFNIAGGGGTSTNGEYSLTGTIGQADAGGVMTGGNYSITPGFWSLITVVPTPGAPLLSITNVSNGVVVFWPSPSTGFILQQTGDVGDPGSWSNYSRTITDDGTNKSVIISVPVGNQLFRLKQ